MADPVRVLCIDNHPDAAESYAEMLRLCGYDARTAADGSAGLAAAEAFRPAVCVVDLNMPGLDGAEVGRRLRDLLGPPVRLILVTAVGDQPAARRVPDGLFDARFTKPVDPGRLLKAVAGVP